MSKLKSQGIEVLVPTLEGPASAWTLAPRLKTFDGKVIGLLSNHKPHADQILRLVVDTLRERYQIRDIIFESKPYVGNVAPGEILDKLARGCDAVITGVGD